MEEKIKLSIIVPVYNVEKYILKCITSILYNKSNNFEVILINDGSLDNSGKICEEFEKKYKRIKYISKKNEGCSATRNLGIKEAKGEYIWFIDSDDFIEKGAVDYLIEKIEKEDTELIIFGNSDVNIKGEKIENKIPEKVEKKEEIYIKEKFLVNIWNKIYKREIIEKNNITFPLDTHMGEDLAFNFEYLFFVDKVKVEKKIFYNYLINTGVTQNINKRKEVFLAFDTLYTFYKEQKKFEEMKDILKKYYLQHAIFYPYNLILSSNVSKKIKKEKLTELNSELNKRKYMFNTNFLYKQIYYYLKFKLDFLRPYYRKIKSINKEK